ncbi:MAG: glycosyltransferase, partial [Planctomycetota bacterium]
AARTPSAGAPIRFIMLGKLDEPWKAARRGVEAFLALPDEIKQTAELHLVAVSDPEAWRASGVVPHRWIDADAVGPFLADMDIMLQLSNTKQETFCQTMVQGMLTGLPIIASDLDVLQEKVADGGGVVVSDSAPVADLTQAMAKLATDSEARVRMGRIGARVARERYVWNADWFSKTYLSQSSV